MDLIADLGSGPVGVDTTAFIYFIEEETPFLGPVEALFTEASAGRLQLVTSALTLLEVLVVPYRAGDNSLAERYEALLTRSRGLHMLDLSPELLRAAAQLRAVTGIKPPPTHCKSRQLSVQAAKHLSPMIAVFPQSQVSEFCKSQSTLRNAKWISRSIHRSR